MQSGSSGHLARTQSYYDHCQYVSTCRKCPNALLQVEKQHVDHGVGGQAILLLKHAPGWHAP
jgi:hypothetical protein